MLRTIDRLAAEVHAPLARYRRWRCAGSTSMQAQRERCHGRQQHTGLAAPLLTLLDDFLQGSVPARPDVIPTGEYTPFKLLYRGSGLSAMLNFGDGLVGPHENDWLGPLGFLAAGDASGAHAPDGAKK